jgi:hypothetical protein
MKLHDRDDSFCPYCGLGISMGVLELEPDDEMPAEMNGRDIITHLEPRCVTFSALDGDVYLRAVQDHNAAKRGAA